MTMSNLKRPHTVMVRTIALCHNGVGAMVSSLSFLSHFHTFLLLFFNMLHFIFHSFAPQF